MSRAFLTIVRRRATGIMTPVLALAALACGDGADPPAAPAPPEKPAPPVQAALKVSTLTTGADLDRDGYVFSIDGGSDQAIGINESRTLMLSTVGARSVKLDGVADNCVVEGSNPRQVSVTAATQTDVSFAVACSANPSIVVTTTTTGPAANPDGYTISVNGEVAGAIGLNESRTFAVGAPGSYIVQLSGLTPACNVTGGNPMTVEATYGTSATVPFAVTCQAVLSGRIAFESNRTGAWDVFVMNPDGTGATNLTKAESWDYEPAFSPDGTLIAFVSDRDAADPYTFYESDVYVMRADGTGIRRLTTAPGEDGLPAWSPDATRILFGSFRGGSHDVWVMNADGTGQKNLTSHPADDFHHSWSPDGKKIAFSSDRDPAYGYDIWVMNADGSNLVNITKHAAGFDARPAWSPDGKRIAFTSNRDGNLEIYVMNADGTKQTRVTNHPELDSYAAWSPDGQYLLFRSDRTGNPEVTRVKVDGTEVTNLTNHPKTDCHPSWAPSPGSFATAWSAPAVAVEHVSSGVPVRSLSAQLVSERTSCFGEK